MVIWEAEIDPNSFLDAAFWLHSSFRSEDIPPDMHDGRDSAIRAERVASIGVATGARTDLRWRKYGCGVDRRT